MENSHFTWLGNIHHSLLPPTLPEQQEYNCCFWLGFLPVADSSNSQILFLSLLVSTFTSSRAVYLSVPSIRRGKLLENMLFEVRYYCYQISNYQTWITEEFIGKIWISVQYFSHHTKETVPNYSILPHSWLPIQSLLTLNTSSKHAGSSPSWNMHQIISCKPR